MATVRLPESLTRHFPGATRLVECDGGTVSGLLGGLDVRWPGMRSFIADSSPRIRKHILVFVDGERATLETELGPTSVVEVIPAISGG